MVFDRFICAPLPIELSGRLFLTNLRSAKTVWVFTVLADFTYKNALLEVASAKMMPPQKVNYFSSNINLSVTDQVRDLNRVCIQQSDVSEKSGSNCNLMVTNQTRFPFPVFPIRES